MTLIYKTWGHPLAVCFFFWTLLRKVFHEGSNTICQLDSQYIRYKQSIESRLFSSYGVCTVWHWKPQRLSLLCCSHMLDRAAKFHSRGGLWPGLLPVRAQRRTLESLCHLWEDPLLALLSLPVAEQFLQAWNKAFRIFAGLDLQLQQWGEKDKYNPVCRGNITLLSALTEASGDLLFLSLYLVSHTTQSQMRLNCLLQPPNLGERRAPSIQKHKGCICIVLGDY